ncbi:MAG: hypothetical protein OEV91_03960 [Desulfobulbaceae bacterium]|nr:hypothetical protein [Desulfobulbaceae bacterium]
MSRRKVYIFQLRIDNLACSGKTSKKGGEQHAIQRDAAVEAVVGNMNTVGEGDGQWAMVGLVNHG